VSVLLYSVQSAPSALFLFLWLFSAGLSVLSFLISYFLRGRRRILGLLLSFLPAIIIMGAFTWEVACSNSSMPPQYVPSTLKYHVTYYVLPSAIGYTASFIVTILRNIKKQGG